MSTHALSPAVFRGEVDGTLREKGSWLRPYFFAEQVSLAQSYARGTEVLCCVVQGDRVLDLTEVDYFCPTQKELVDKLQARFDEWICRLSGEPRNAWDYLESQDLYHYEGTGEATRWMALFQIALDEMGFDAVRIRDSSDTVNGAPSTVWVTLHRENIRMATAYEETLSRLRLVRQGDITPVEFETWLSMKQPELGRRVDRLMNSESFERMEQDLGHAFIDDGLPCNQFVIQMRHPAQNRSIAPGDRVRICIDHVDTESPEGLRSLLSFVEAEDLLEDGDGLIYLPRAWRNIGHDSCASFLDSLKPEQLRMLIEGENASLMQNEVALTQLRTHIMEHAFNPEHTGYYHGPDHWHRVSRLGRSVARSVGVDPLVAHVFGLVHDSQRLDEGLDPGHGPRAAAFITEHRDDLFSFLNEHEVSDLTQACELHSNGVTQGSIHQQVCFDADRLDLWRVGIQPHPELLCTRYAKSATTIRSALAHLQRDQKNEFMDELEHSEEDSFDRNPWRRLRA